MRKQLLLIAIAASCVSPALASDDTYSYGASLQQMGGQSENSSAAGVSESRIMEITPPAKAPQPTSTSNWVSGNNWVSGSNAAVSHGSTSSSAGSSASTGGGARLAPSVASYGSGSAPSAAVQTYVWTK